MSSSVSLSIIFVDEASGNLVSKIWGSFKSSGESNDFLKEMNYDEIYAKCLIFHHLGFKYILKSTWMYLNIIGEERFSEAYSEPCQTFNKSKINKNNCKSIKLSKVRDSCSATLLKVALLYNVSFESL